MYSAKKAKLCVTFYFKVFFFQSWRDVSARVRGSRQFNPLLSPRTARGVAEIGNGEILRFHKCFTSCIYQGFGEVNVVGKNQTEELEDFEVFNIRNTVNIIAYSVMSAGAEIWNIFFMNIWIQIVFCQTRGPWFHQGWPDTSSAWLQKVMIRLLQWVMSD